jgi:hypothetical protein
MVVVAIAVGGLSFGAWSAVSAGATSQAPVSGSTSDTNICTATLDPAVQPPAADQQLPVTISTDAFPQPHDSGPITLSNTKLTVSLPADILQSGVNAGFITDGMHVPTTNTFTLAGSNTIELKQPVTVSLVATVHVVNGIAQPLTATAPLPDTTWDPVDATQPVMFSESAMKFVSMIGISPTLTLRVTFDCVPSDPAPVIVALAGTPASTTTIALSTTTATTMPPTSTTTTTVPSACNAPGNGYGDRNHVHCGPPGHTKGS